MLEYVYIFTSNPEMWELEVKMYTYTFKVWGRDPTSFFFNMEKFKAGVTSHLPQSLKKNPDKA